MRVIKNFSRFRLVIEGKTSTEILKSSGLEFLENVLVNNVTLSGAEDNISGPLNRGGIADLLSHHDRNS